MARSEIFVDAVLVHWDSLLFFYPPLHLFLGAKLFLEAKLSASAPLSPPSSLLQSSVPGLASASEDHVAWLA